MTIENCKILYFGLVSVIVLYSWVFEVKNDAHSILVVVSGDSIVRVGTIREQTTVVWSGWVLGHFCSVNVHTKSLFSLR